MELSTSRLRLKVVQESAALEQAAGRLPLVNGRDSGALLQARENLPHETKSINWVSLARRCSPRSPPMPPARRRRLPWNKRQKRQQSARTACFTCVFACPTVNRGIACFGR